MPVPARLRRQIIERAGNRCEYCGLSQLGQAGTFHIDHIHPQVSGGATELENLAQACVWCSLRKGARLSARDPRTGRTAALFHPRAQRWNHHFRWNGTDVAGITAVGRATVEALAMNSAEHQVIRAFEAMLGRHPPPGHV